MDFLTGGGGGGGEATNAVDFLAGESGAVRADGGGDVVAGVDAVTAGESGAVSWLEA
jgi:hypothetical protein